MLMVVNDLLELGNNAEERQEIRDSIKHAVNMRDEDIDFSDIPEIKDFSNWRPAKPFIEKMRKNNRKIRFQREGLPEPDEILNKGMASLENILGVDGANAFIEIILADKINYTEWRRHKAEPIMAV